jgi:thiamine-phosphate pyrophosphorylase
MLSDPAILRVLDANANRAREALRVAEDYARFVLDSPRLTEALKGLRHRLREAVALLGRPAQLLAARNTPGDVGTSVATEAEFLREDGHDVARAAVKRLQEALRSLEEFGKTIEPEAARRLEALRYETYDLERQLSAAPHPRLANARLYVILTTDGDTEAVAAAALRGGADVLQLRETRLSARDLLPLARRLRELAHDAGALLIVNDRPDITLLSGADGVHVGQDDLPVREARRLLGPDRIVGATANAVELATRAEADGADYVGCGAMFPTATKPGREAVGPERLAEVTAAVRVPVFAIGGIDLTTVDAVVATGVRRVAICAAVVAAPDVEAAARAFAEKLRDLTDD